MSDIVERRPNVLKRKGLLGSIVYLFIYLMWGEERAIAHTAKSLNEEASKESEEPPEAKVEAQGDLNNADAKISEIYGEKNATALLDSILENVNIDDEIAELDKLYQEGIACNEADGPAAEIKKWSIATKIAQIKRSIENSLALSNAQATFKEDHRFVLNSRKLLNVNDVLPKMTKNEVDSLAGDINERVKANETLLNAFGVANSVNKADVEKVFDELNALSSKNGDKLLNELNAQFAELEQAEKKID